MSAQMEQPQCIDDPRTPAYDGTGGIFVKGDSATMSSSEMLTIAKRMTNGSVNGAVWIGVP